ncbi:MAG: type VI secretion system tip protein VgrG [Cloacibacillus sp.]|nr:type VI secretion system tip protein VgrG [Cloacibacillus sp.]
MANKYTELFCFEAEGMPQDTFHVLSFRGTEGLSSLFSFDIELVSENLSVDLGALLSGSANLTVKREGAPDAVFAGRPAAARQNGHFENHAYYSVQLRPAFWKFTQLIQSAIFLNKSAPDTVEEIIGSERFFPLKHEMRLTRGGYPNQEFAMQHEESLYDYITWRIEQQGAYFYFAPDGDTVIFSDSPQSHDAPSGTIYYSPATGLEGDRRGEVATSFSLCQTPLPARVVVRSYSWQNPNLPIVAEAPVTPDGFGDVYLAHEPAETKADAARIAEIRAEELRCHSRIFTGTSASPLMRPGALFTLDRHYNEAFNRDYMVTEVSHEGAQEAFISLGLGIPLRGAAEHLFYRNEFRCIESAVPYRPVRRAPRAKITGVMRAFVDGAGSGARAETDEYGRYKLVFPFDISGRSGGNASCWIRMSQQQAGQDSGLALPVQPGTEALVAFEEGDPDRPYISGVLSNCETGSIYGSGNRNISGLRTAGGNQITINDDDKKQGISLLMPTGNGLMMSAGSSDVIVSKNDSDLKLSSASVTGFAGILQSYLCGFRSLTCSTTDWGTCTALGAMFAAAGTCISNSLLSLSKSSAYLKPETPTTPTTPATPGTPATHDESGKTKKPDESEKAETSVVSEGCAWAAGGMKDVTLALDLFLQSYGAANAGLTSYGVVMTADEKTSSSLITAKAGEKELVALVLSIR